MQRRFGAVDFFFNNAGVIGECDKGVLTSSGATWRWVLDTNVMGLIHGMHAFVPQMEAGVTTPLQAQPAHEA